MPHLIVWDVITRGPADLGKAFLPHAVCYLWDASLLAVHAITDALIGVSYVAISGTLAYLVYRARRDVPFHWVVLAFGVFIVACGMTHFIELWTLWSPRYWLAGHVKIITALASVATALVLPPLVPRALALIEAAKLSNDRARSLERTHLELEAAHARVKDLDRLKTDFFANVSHELRTPLALILGPVDRLLQASDLPGESRGELAVVRQNAQLLLRHVNDLLDVSKLEAGKTEPAYRHLDLAALVRLAAAHFDALAAERGMRYRVETPATVPAELDGDKVERVVLNLLSNAFKFTPDGGTVRCALTAGAEIVVEDSGPGIAPGMRQAVFDRFRQGEGGPNRRFGGTGLGLAIAREFVGLHGGSIDVDDSPLGGARFTVRFRVTAPAGARVEVVGVVDHPELAEQAMADVRSQPPPRPAVDRANAAVERPGDRPTVLVVEDNLEMNRFLVRLLRPHYRVLSAFTGTEALARLGEAQPDLVLTDVMMPEADGAELVRRIRQRREFDTIAIMLLTAKADDDLRARVLRDGAQDYVTKPFAVDEVLARVANLVTLKRARDVLQAELASQSADVAALAAELATRSRALRAAQAEAQAAQRRLELLADASGLLASSLDYETTLVTVARHAVPALADWCAVDVLTDDNQPSRLAVIHADPAKAPLARELQERYAPRAAAPHGIGRVMVTGQSEFQPEVDHAEFLGMAQDDRHAAIVRELGLGSFMCVPIQAGGAVRGAISFVCARGGRRFVPDDLALAEALARRAALAIENARLYREAEVANRTKDEFLATLSHELRTPLNAMLGWASMLRDGGLAPSTAARAADVIERNARVQAQLIDDLLDVSRIITGKLRLDIQPVDLAPIIEAAIEATRGAAEAKGLHVAVHLGRRVGPVPGDAHRLQQVVWNLLSNAIKFTPKGGHVTVTLEAVESCARLEVRDSGIGIDPAFLPQVFDRFRQAEAPTTRTQRGLGLGLAIVKHLVDLHGGRVRAESAGEGRGASFTVELPIRAVAERPDTGDRRSSSAGGPYASPPILEGLRILVVDDDPDARELLTTILSRCRATVTAVATAPEALEALERGTFDLLVSDLGLPAEDGYSLIRRVRARERAHGGRLPAVAVSAYARSEDRRLALLAGFQMHVAKPIQPGELVGIVAGLATTLRA